MKLILRFIALKMSILRVDAAIIKRKKVKRNLYPSRIIVGTDMQDERLVEAAQIFANLLREGAIKENIDAAALSLPLVPHLLSLNILSSSARIMLKQICGAEMAALYSVDYNCVQIITILFDSVNKAWAPWLMDALHEKEYSQTKKVSIISIFISAQYFCGFPVSKVLSIIVVERYLDYFTTIMEDRL